VIYSINPSTNKAQDYIRYANVLLDYAEATDMANRRTYRRCYMPVQQGPVPCRDA
jgi:hypothetical protein